MNTDMTAPVSLRQNTAKRIVACIIYACAALIPLCYVRDVADAIELKWFMLEFAMLCAAGLFLLLDRDACRGLRTTEVLALIYLLWTVAAHSQSRFPWTGLDRILEVAAGMALFWLTGRCFAACTYRRLCGVIAATGFIVACISQWQQLGLPHRFAGANSATIGHQNFLASFLIVPIFLSLGLVFEARETKWRMSWCLMGMFMFTRFLQAESRGGYVGFAAGAGVLLLLSMLGFALFRQWLRRHLVRILVGAGATVPLLAIVFAGSSIQARVRSITDMQQDTIHFRFVIWSDTMDMIRKHPWIGWGPGTYRLVIEAYRDPELTIHEGIVRRHNPVNTLILHAHNEYLEVASETGVPGMLLLLALVISLIAIPPVRLRLGDRTSVLSLACTAAVAGVFVHAVFTPAMRVADVNLNVWMAAAGHAVCRWRKGEA